MIDLILFLRVVFSFCFLASFFALICLCFFLKDAKQLEKMQKIMVVAMSITLLTGIMLIFATNT